MATNYEFGGILKAIKSQNNETKVEGEDEENDEKQILEDLFSYKLPEVVEEEFLDEEDLDDVKKLAEEQNEDGSKTTEGSRKKKKVKQIEDPERLERTLFVGNVATSVTRKTLKKLFLKYGEIESIRIRSVPTADPKTPKKVALIKKVFHAERDNMNAYVVFKTKEAAEKTLEQTGYMLEGHRLRLDICGLKSKHEHKKCLFIGNLPFKITEEEIHQHFIGCGEIDDIRIVRDKATGLGKGFAYVKFKNTESVMFGLKLNSSKLNGRALRVSRSSEHPSKPLNKSSGKPFNKSERNNKYKSSSQQNFSGLRSTSKKDRELGKKEFSLPKKSSNALRRIQSKQNKQTANKHNRNKQRNMQRKVNKPKK